MSRSSSVRSIRTWKQSPDRFANRYNFFFNILRILIPSILLLICVAFLMNFFVFSLKNYACRIANLFSFRKMYTFLLLLLRIINI